MEGLVIIIMLVFDEFILTRGMFVSWCNETMYREAIKEVGISKWYTEFNVFSAMFNPIHFLKWTPRQWIKYQKNIYKD